MITYPFYKMETIFFTLGEVQNIALSGYLFMK